jgi:hypothetical protein
MQFQSRYGERHARTHTHTSRQHRNIRILVYFLFRTWKFATNRSAYEMNTSWGLVQLVATKQCSSTQYASLIYKDAARHTTLFCGCKLLVQRNTKCEHRTHANSCHYVYRPVFKHECVHTLRKTRAKLESHDLACVFILWFQNMRIGQYFQYSRHLCSSQTWTIQQCVCHHFHFSGRNEDQFGCQTNTYTHDPRSSDKLPLWARPNIRYELRSEAYFQEVQKLYITSLSLTRRQARGPYSSTCFFAITYLDVKYR